METSNATPRSGAYWFIQHSLGSCRSILARHRQLFHVSAMALLFNAFIFRASVQWLVLDARRHLVELVFLIAVLSLSSRLSRSRRRSGKATCVALVALCACVVVNFSTVHNYLQMYFRYQRLSAVEVTTLPTTGFERVQPRRSIFALAHDAVSEGESPLEPDFIRKGGEYYWSMAIEPAYAIARVVDGVSQIINVEADVSTPNFGPQSRMGVHFSTGERLLFSRNAATATIRSFGAFRYLNYEPSGVIYLPDENGHWVQVVTLIRWRGLFFPYPEFGGVQLVRESPDSLAEYPALLFTGAGEWVSPQEIADISFLRGQNIVPIRVSRAIADSFRFQGGFFGPFPGFHEQDVRVPHLDSEVNPQPFTVYLTMDGETQGKLYHSFALEPADVEKQGLNTSVFVPADSIGPVRVLHHLARGGVLSGASSIATKVMESRKSYDWERNRPVEHRPFIRDIDGKRRFFWMTTVVTSRLGEMKDRYIAGSIPELVLTDAEYNIPVWVDPTDQLSWIPKIREELGRQWAVTEGRPVAAE